ncbi:MAG: hypothetical protein P1U56_21800 [Saprospiraceae bacterium]|nr:hypothetical protein [Saprospiraceae bacterium]MDF1698501.1 hypothetical protein [Saprospiraceae bacterium]
MWYISFHGGSDGVNNIHVYHNSGKPHSNPNILPTSSNNPELSELRAFYIKNDLLYVVNGYKKYSQVLVYKANSDGAYSFDRVLASIDELVAVFHPYDITFDEKDNCYISNQDSNTVIGVSGPNQALDVASFLKDTYPSEPFYPGSQVASSIGGLPNLPNPIPPNVNTPQGLDVSFDDDSDSKVAHSIRGVLYYDSYLFVSDQPADAVKIYHLESGELYSQIKGDNLCAPVQLLLQGGVLYIGSSGNNSVVTYDLANGVPSTTVEPELFIDGHAKHVSGMAFDDDGNFYVAERKANKIKKFPNDGSGKGETFIDDLPDNPEFILYVPKSSS